MKSKNFYIAIFLTVSGFLLFTAFASTQSQTGPEKNKKLIKFSHSFHIENATEDCGTCHSKVAESTSLSDTLLPTMDDCSQCHDVEDDKNCSQCHYEDVLEPLVQKKSEIFFNHKFHIEKENAKCTDCHKGIEKVDYAFEAKDFLPSMKTCNKCHNNESKASNACESCHESTANLLPQNHKTADFLATHKFDAEAPGADCSVCHTDNSCEDCHVATTHIDENNTRKNFYAPYSPHNFTAGIKQQKIERVHGLNYIYTHGIDAESGATECRTCHNTETFCVACHTSEYGDFSASGILPASHKVANFTTIGVGTGGGEHAVLAKRDIESCVACHDVEGGDPTCVQCHIDNDGIKGTNPKTHPAGFMHDVHGDWHESDGSVCYTCHTTASASTGVAGVGFCGYCHGAK